MTTLLPQLAPRLPGMLRLCRLVLRLCPLLLCWLTPRPGLTQGLIIPSGAYVIASNGNIVTAGNWMNNGTFTHNGGAVVFAGATQTLGGSSSTQFNNLSTATGSTTTITSPGQKVVGVVSSNGTLNANGNLTLISTAAQTALIDGNGAGEVLGNVTMQRYLASGFGYKYFSSPFKADTVNDFSSAINLSTSFPDVYSYDESLTSAGWVIYTNPSGPLKPIQGYAVNFGTSMAAKTVSLTGVVSNHAVASPTLFNHNNTFTLGFNLAGNPYPSPVNWDASTGWTKTNIDNALYFFSAGTTDQYTGTYSSYIGGVSSDGVASGIISAMQGFFIHVSNGTFPVSGQLTANNNARNLNPSTVFFGLNGPEGPPPLLRLRAGFADETMASDPVVIYLKQGANGVFDKKLDALKLMNTHTGVPSLYAVSADLQRLSINALPYPQDTLTIVPLGLITAKSGWVSFVAGDLQDMPAGLHIYLSDVVAGINQDLGRPGAYRLYLAPGEYANRFFLKFSAKELITANTGTTSPSTWDAYATGGKLYVNGRLAPGEKGNLVMMNLLGQVTGRQEISGDNYQIIPVNFITGLYIIRFETLHGKSSKKVFIGSQ